jgi:hypothetical protein
MAEAGQILSDGGDAQAQVGSIELDCTEVRVQVVSSGSTETEVTRAYAVVAVSELGGGEPDVEAWRCDIETEEFDLCGSAGVTCAGQGALPPLECEQVSASLGGGVVRVPCGVAQVARSYDTAGELVSETRTASMAHRARVRAR